MKMSNYFLIFLSASRNALLCPALMQAAIFSSQQGPHISGKPCFFRITVPLLGPTIKMCILMDIIGTIKIFDLVFSMTEGGPNGLTNLPTTLMYQEAFKYDHYGAGSAIGIVILLICLAGTKLSELFPSVKEKA
jgi:ABC-type Fe3+ transport system permease subunit